MMDCLPEKDYDTRGLDNCFITSNILHSAIIIWSSSNRSDNRYQVMTHLVTGFRNMWGSQGNFHGGFLACSWYNHES